MVRVGQVETVSLQQDFYRQLGKIRNQYSWQIDEDNNIVAQRGRTTYNPVTALAKWYGHTSAGNNKRETVRVGRQLGLPREFVEHVYKDRKSTRLNSSHT